MVKRSKKRGKTQGHLTVAVVAFNGISPFHLSVPCLVFGEDRSELGVRKYQLLVCAAEHSPLRTATGFEIVTRHSIAALSRADLIIIPSWRAALDRPPQALIAALQRAHHRGALIVGLCLGAFVLAEAGLLDGLTATTHWNWASEFTRRYPKVQLNTDVLYVDAGSVLTSAGTAAAIDCCLYLLRQHCGAEVANRVARRLVVAPHREGGQAQFIEHPVPATPQDTQLSRMLQWLLRHIEQPHDIDSLAHRAAMSRRSFTRHFRQLTGTTVVQWLLNQRLALAQRLLEASHHSIDRIAIKSGFGATLSFRQHFRRAFNMTPTTYRRQFKTTIAPSIERNLA